MKVRSGARFARAACVIRSPARARRPPALAQPARPPFPEDGAMSTPAPFAGRVFNLSMPRNGLASFARFCRDIGLATALSAPTRDHRWTAAWHDGDIDSIFASPGFADARAFAGSPWWLPEFYKVVFHRFPGARFVLLTREPEAWFGSMLAGGGVAPAD